MINSTCLIYLLHRNKTKGIIHQLFTLFFKWCFRRTCLRHFTIALHINAYPIGWITTKAMVASKRRSGGVTQAVPVLKTYSTRRITISPPVPNAPSAMHWVICKTILLCKQSRIQYINTSIVHLLFKNISLYYISVFAIHRIEYI